MLFVLLPFVLLAISLWADRRCWRRYEGNLWQRRLLAVWLAVTQLPLPLVFVLGFLLPDNTTRAMTVAMWLLWGWMAAVLPRLLYYILRRVGLPRVGWVAAIALFGCLIWGVTTGRTSIRVKRVEITSDRLPAAFDGVRIVQLSDMHVGSLIHPESEIDRIVDTVEALHPDMICFTGDLVNIRAAELTDAIVARLGRLRAPMGTYSVIGNHDSGAYIKDTVACPSATSLQRVIACQRAAGWRVLNDTTLYVVRGDDSITLSGIAFDPQYHKIRHDRNLPKASIEPIYCGVPDTVFNITLSHLPQLWDQILEQPYADLTLSGHVHAMQMKISLFGQEFSPAQFMYDRWSGRYDDLGRTLYINDGTGYVGYPMRLGAWPEVTLITLRRCE